MRLLIPAAACLLLLLGVLTGCGSSSPGDLPNQGKSMLFVPGILGFDIECIPDLEGGTSGVDVFYGIPTSTLTFLKSGAGFQSVYDLSLRVLDERGTYLINETSWQETTYVAQYEETQRTGPIENVRRIAVTPGRRRIELRLEQLFDRTSAVRMQVIDVPSASDGRPEAGKVFVRWREPRRGMIPCVFFHIPYGLDSLEGDVQMFHLPEGNLTRVDFAFERFRYDTTVAKAPHLYATVVPFQRTFSVEDKGVFDSILAVRGYVLPGSNGSTSAFRIPAVAPGLYRISVRATVPGGSTDGGDTVLSVHRVISIKGVTFPRPSTLDELIDPLAYIATNDEMEHIRSSKTPEERRERFDLFWLSHATDRAAAANLLKEYYTRVMDANRYFSGVKEGWKTEAGMVYIVLGPPSAASSTFETQVWQYSIPGMAGSTPFRFTMITITGEGLSLKDYSLYRDAIYEDPWTRMVARWRRGSSF